MTEGITAHEVDAEQALLGVLIDAPQLAESCGVMPSDLDPDCGHPEILGAILSVYETKRTADPVLLLDELRRRDQLNRIGTGPLDGSSRGALYLHELMQAGRGVGTLRHHAQLVRAATVRRRIYDVGSKLVKTATSQADLDLMLDNASTLAVSLGLLVDEPIDGDAPIPGLGLVDDFVREPSPPHSWVIPGICERADRVMLIAGEGAGKSVLARQVCTLLAAGRHPFAPKQAIRPRRTLLVDLENPPDLVRRNLRGIVGQVWDEGLDVGDRAWRWNRPGGMDLRSTADRALLARVIEKTRPDLVAIGPLYKASLARPGDTYEVAAAEVAAAIDALRERYGCAFWIEHHMPKGDGTGRRGDPIGSGLWMRWPEFGLHLRADPDGEGNVYLLDRFRGDRDERAWPDKLIKRAGRYPWTPDWDDAAVKNQLFDAIDEDKADTGEEPPAVPAKHGHVGRPLPVRPSPDDIEVMREQRASDHSGPISRAQLGELAAAFTRAGVADRYDRLQVCSTVTGRDVTSPTELTAADFDAVLAHLAEPSLDETSARNASAVSQSSERVDNLLQHNGSPLANPALPLPGDDPAPGGPA